MFGTILSYSRGYVIKTSDNCVAMLKPLVHSSVTLPEAPRFTVPRKVIHRI
jgi:hypothetical protein